MRFSGLKRKKDEVRSQGLQPAWQILSEKRSDLEDREYVRRVQHQRRVQHRSRGSNAEFGPEPTISHKSRFAFIIFMGVWGLSACSTLYTPAVSSDKTSLLRASEYNVQLGLSYLKVQDISRAKYKLLLALHQAPSSATAQSAMAYFLSQTGEPKQAEKYYLKAIKLNPKSGATHNHYGSFLCQQGRYAEAETHFLRAVQDLNYLNLSEIYENAGLCALHAKNTNKAIFYFKKALEKDPTRTIPTQMIITLQAKK